MLDFDRGINLAAQLSTPESIMPEKRAVSGDGAGPAAKKAALSSPTEELLGAVKSGDHDQVASLLSAGAPTTSADADGNAALWLACARVVAIKLDTGQTPASNRCCRLAPIQTWRTDGACASDPSTASLPSTRTRPRSSYSSAN